MPSKKSGNIHLFFRGILSHFSSPHPLFLWRHIFWDTLSNPFFHQVKKKSILSPYFYGLERLLLKKGFVPDQTLWGKPLLCLFSWPCLRGKTRQNLISEFIQNALSFNWVFHKRNQTKETHKQMDERTDLLKYNVASLLKKMV